MQQGQMGALARDMNWPPVSPFGPSECCADGVPLRATGGMPMGGGMGGMPMGGGGMGGGMQGGPPTLPCPSHTHGAIFLLRFLLNVSACLLPTGGMQQMGGQMGGQMGMNQMGGGMAGAPMQGGYPQQGFR